MNAEAMDPAKSETTLSEFTSPPGLPSHLKLIERIGAGGMGVIYKAENRYSGAKLAVKVMLPELLSDVVNAQRFVQEARNVCILKDPHIVAIHDCGMTEGENSVPYIVMDFVDGTTLEEKVLQKKKLDFDEAVLVMQQTAQALAHAHKKGVVHRDLKPSNVMLEKSDDGTTNVKVLDFGLSKVFSDATGDRPTNLTQTGEVVGTPCYMSPEQCLGLKVDGRSDIYALGCLMYETLTGDPPFSAGSVVKVMSMQANVLVPDIGDKRADLPLQFRQILMRCLEKDAADRYQSMDEVIQHLQALRTGKFVGIHLSGLQRRKVRGLLQTIIFGAVGFGIGLLIIQGLQLISNMSLPHP